MTRHISRITNRTLALGLFWLVVAAILGWCGVFD